VVRLGFLLVGAMLSAVVALAAPQPVFADCVAGGPVCFEVDPPSAPRGAIVSVNLGVSLCQGAELGFSRTSPSGRIHRSVKLRGTADPTRTEFVVPDIPAGRYDLGLECPGEPVVSGGDWVVLAAPPDTAASVDSKTTAIGTRELTFLLAVFVVAWIAAGLTMRRRRHS
jgi:hypothetical protein